MSDNNNNQNDPNMVSDMVIVSYCPNELDIVDPETGQCIPSTASAFAGGRLGEITVIILAILLIVGLVFLIMKMMRRKQDDDEVEYRHGNQV